MSGVPCTLLVAHQDVVNLGGIHERVKPKTSVTPSISRERMIAWEPVMRSVVCVSPAAEVSGAVLAEYPVVILMPLIGSSVLCNLR